MPSMPWRSWNCLTIGTIVTVCLPSKQPTSKESRPVDQQTDDDLWGRRARGVADLKCPSCSASKYNGHVVQSTRVTSPWVAAWVKQAAAAR